MGHAASHVTHQLSVFRSHCGDPEQHNLVGSISGRTALPSMKWISKSWRLGATPCFAADRKGAKLWRCRLAAACCSKRAGFPPNVNFQVKTDHRCHTRNVEHDSIARGSSSLRQSARMDFSLAPLPAELSSCKETAARFRFQRCINRRHSGPARTKTCYVPQYLQCGGQSMQPTASWLQVLRRMTRRVQRRRRRLARSAAADGRDNLHELFLFGPHG